MSAMSLILDVYDSENLKIARQTRLEDPSVNEHSSLKAFTWSPMLQEICAEHGLSFSRVIGRKDQNRNTSFHQDLFEQVRHK